MSTRSCFRCFEVLLSIWWKVIIGCLCQKGNEGRKSVYEKERERSVLSHGERASLWMCVSWSTLTMKKCEKWRRRSSSEKLEDKIV